MGLRRGAKRLRRIRLCTRRRRALTAAISCSGGTVTICREDLGRHNAFDKVGGGRLREGIDLRDR